MKDDIYEEIPIDNLDGFFKSILKKKESFSNDELFWFRGHTNADFKLVPCIYRKINPLCRLRIIERQMVEAFMVRNYHLITGRIPTSNWEWLCLMQHFNAPTRLLDWTENAITALMFALEPYFIQDEFDRGILPCVWMLEPGMLNREYFNKGEIPNLAMLNSNYWLKLRARPEHKNEIKKVYIDGFKNSEQIYHPIAVYHPYNNERIRAQSGVFSLFPLFSECDEPQYENECKACGLRPDVSKYAMEKCDTGKYLTKYVITKPASMSEELKAIGMKRSAIYPEMPVVSKEIEKYILSCK
jgi:FRG domain.